MLAHRVDGSFKVLECINDNAYKVDLPGNYGVSTTLNVANLTPYLDYDCLSDLREILLKKARTMNAHPHHPLHAQIKVKGA